ncbi:MAG: hypothetical protein EA427_05905 [Spirochaetaceae bacterium]|nr:MAG: hypothetical protein EA427_05905 [Spirochaetaceae bacterium]
MMVRRLFYGLFPCLLVVFLGTATLPAQEEPDIAPIDPALQRGYRELQLGDSYAAVEETLQRDPNFDYRGAPDVSLAPGTNDRVIDTRGRGYVERGLFQFQEGNLYIMALYLNRGRLDYFQLFNQLRQRYGDPRDLDPHRAIWEDQMTRIELERPLTVRYLDLATFEARRRERRELQALEDLTREQFLEDF